MVTVLAVLGVLGVLFAAAVLSTREGPVLADAPPDAADVPLPDGPLTPEDVGRLRFSLAPRGYRMAEVDLALERLAAELADRDRRLGLLGAATTGSAPAPEVREATPADLPAAAPPVAAPTPPPAATAPGDVPSALTVTQAPAQPWSAAAHDPGVTRADPAAGHPLPDPLPPVDLGGELRERLDQAPTAPDGATNPPADPPSGPVPDPLPPADLGSELITPDRQHP